MGEAMGEGHVACGMRTDRAPMSARKSSSSAASGKRCGEEAEALALGGDTIKRPNVKAQKKKKPNRTAHRCVHFFLFLTCFRSPTLLGVRFRLVQSGSGLV